MDFVICSECGQGHYRMRSCPPKDELSCNHCGHIVGWGDLEDVFYNPQWDVIVALPERTLEVMAAFRQDLGIDLAPWHTGGGCMALGAALPDGREVLVTGGDADLPGSAGTDDLDLFGAVFGPVTEDYDYADGEAAGYSGTDLGDLIQRIQAQLR